MTEMPEPERAELRIPKAALKALAAAVEVRTVATVKDPSGLDWYYPLVRHEALRIRVEMKGLHRRSVAADWQKLEAA